MEKEIRQLAWKEYLHYFRILLTLTAVFVGAAILIFVFKNIGGKVGPRANTEAPAERVYDKADVLTDEEEQKLRDYIAKRESKYGIDIVLVTIKEDVESLGRWETVMMNKADDFYDENNFGYNRVHGDGILLLDNWYGEGYASQKGSWVSTCGKVETYFGDYAVDSVLDVVYDKVDRNPYKAYKAYVDETCRLMKSKGRGYHLALPWGIIIFVPGFIAICYAVVYLGRKPARDTTTASTYLEGGKPVIQAQGDTFMHKNTTSHIISSGSSSGGGGSRSGGGGHHTSRGGVSHGGGGRRR